MSDSGSEDGSSWDVEKYRVDYESDEHWSLRKVSRKKNRIVEKCLNLSSLNLFRTSWKRTRTSSLKMKLSV